jgi:hypothetical protein
VDAESFGGVTQVAAIVCHDALDMLPLDAVQRRRREFMLAEFVLGRRGGKGGEDPVARPFWNLSQPAELADLTIEALPAAASKPASLTAVPCTASASVMSSFSMKQPRPQVPRRGVFMFC